jgi:hypothetical protein
VHLKPIKKGRRFEAYLVGQKEKLVTNSRDPEHDACRVLVSRGYAGVVQFYHGITPSMRLHAPVAARLTVSEEDRRGLRLRKWAPFSDCCGGGSSTTAV